MMKRGGGGLGGRSSRMRDEEEDGWWGVVGGGVIDPLLSRAPADCGKGVLTMNGSLLHGERSMRSEDF